MWVEVIVCNISVIFETQYSYVKAEECHKISECCIYNSMTIV